eukprot:CAMPEP_0172432504 /NCGR_PEP_ID=MMETSP1064-20121228/63729_1 /TAXON_ID=202472 /ORGANISM="Aulacoseira subarctica , Strain CCAP 1002/5" /LENGTH=536 /DNA_ID=CAMNT_0013179871 /DNA_START=234 /DNA_END=1840 /DNA_ORIENTATION=-
MASSNVLDPFLQRQIRSLGWLKNVAFSAGQESDSLNVTVHLRIPSMLHPQLQELKARISSAAREAVETMNLTSNADLISVNVNISLEPTKPLHLYERDPQQLQLQQLESLGPGLASVTHSVAIYSCKGGVGKSTIAVNLAYELAHRGVRVGLLDVDLHGPSLPTLVKPNDTAVRRSPLGTNMVYPIQHGGVKLMSLGFVSPKSGVPGAAGTSGAAVMRGPMTSKVVTQLLKGTDWGELDVLLLDFPPGTGDVQLTVCQQLTLSGAVIVTTPSNLALVDAVKGVDMFEAMGISTLAVVENMSFFKCSDGTKHFPFGKGISSDNNNIAEMLGVDPSSVFSLGISSHISNANESGIPMCLSRPMLAESELEMYSNLASSTEKQLFSLQYGLPLLNRNEESSGDGEETTATFDDDTNDSDEEFPLHSAILLANNDNYSFTLRMFSQKKAAQKTLAGDIFRLVHPRTGYRLDQIDADNSNDKTFRTMMATSQTEVKTACGSGGDISSTSGASRRLFPVKIEKKGNYGYSCEWADGSTIIYS